MKKIVLLCFILSAFNIYAQKKKIIYKYKKHETYDFSALNVEGDLSGPSDLSVGSRFRKKFRNKIPVKKNFNKELLRGLDSIY